VQVFSQPKKRASRATRSESERSTLKLSNKASNPRMQQRHSFKKKAPLLPHFEECNERLKSKEEQTNQAPPKAQGRYLFIYKKKHTCSFLFVYH
jgi:hypothetical protein